jgi:hypothetical protein
VKRPSTDDPNVNAESRKRHASGTGSSIVPTVIPKAEPGSTEPIERAHADTVLNFLLRLACQVSWHCCTSHTLHTKIIKNKIRETINLPVVLYGSETWSVTPVTRIEFQLV